MQKHVKVGHLRLTLTDVVLIKVGISLAIVAAFYLPEPWSVPTGIAANMIWIWRL